MAKMKKLKIIVAGIVVMSVIFSIIFLVGKFPESFVGFVSEARFEKNMKIGTEEFKSDFVVAVDDIDCLEPSKDSITGIPTDFLRDAEKYMNCFTVKTSLGDMRIGDKKDFGKFFTVQLVGLKGATQYEVNYERDADRKSIGILKNHGFNTNPSAELFNPVGVFLLTLKNKDYISVEAEPKSYRFSETASFPVTVKQVLSSEIEGGIIVKEKRQKITDKEMSMTHDVKLKASTVILHSVDTGVLGGKELSLKDFVVIQLGMMSSKVVEDKTFPLVVYNNVLLSSGKEVITGYDVSPEVTVTERKFTEVKGMEEFVNEGDDMTRTSYTPIFVAIILLAIGYAGYKILIGRR